MATNAKQARKEWEAGQHEKPAKPVLPVRNRKRRVRFDGESRRQDALYRNAQMVYDYDRDFDVEFS